MDAKAREILCRIVAEYGRELSNDPRRVEALMKDLCPALRMEISVITQAAREKVPELLEAPEAPLPVRVKKAVARLVHHTGMHEAAAEFAVGCWVVALGLGVAEVEAPEPEMEIVEPAIRPERNSPRVHPGRRFSRTSLARGPGSATSGT